MSNSLNVLLDYSNITPEQLTHIKDSHMKNYEDLISQLIEISDNELTWNNFVQKIIDCDNSDVNMALLQMKDFSVDEKIRTLCSDLETEVEQWFIEQSMRKDLYHKYKFYWDNQYKTEKDSLSLEQKSYLENVMIGYKVSGLELPDEKFNELKEIKKQVSELCSEFSLNLGNENYSEEIKLEEFSGLPEKFIEERLNKETGCLKITLKYPDVVPIMEYASNRELRKKISILFKSRCINENTVLVEKVLDYRVQIAKLFGFENYSDYKLQDSMAESTQAVNDFLSNLLAQVKPLLHKDLEFLSKLAKEDGIDKLEPWDISYYSRIFVEKTCNFDKEQLKQYFPVTKVITGALEIYQKLLGYRFEKVTTHSNTFWHDSVELYQVFDQQTDQTIGYFYLDLYPREGKYSHAACFPFVTKSDKSLPVATMGCNFGTGNLSFDEVETFFHEFGHVMHHLSSESTIKDTASFSCEHDFVETPSQMFEEWCYAKETLKLMSDNLPEDLVDKLNHSRKLLQGYHYSRQLLFGHYDMFIHSSKYVESGLKPKQIFDKLHREILELDPVPNTSEPANFGHLMGGYDAGYYGYAWSLVYAKDLFGMFKDGKYLDQTLGMKLRKEVLSKGSIRKSMDSIKVFLGRDPSNAEFINSIC